MAITSSADLISYSLRKLGAPVIEINVDDDQLNDRLEEALQVYQDFHSDAVIRTYLTHEITQTDIDNKSIDLSGVDIVHLRKVFQIESHSATNMFSIEYQMHLHDIFDLRVAGDLSNYVQVKQYLNLMDKVMDGEEFVRYNRHGKTLHIDNDWDKISVGDYVIIEAFVAEDSSNIYNDMWLKKYLTALIKQQWGTNLKKFEGMQLPGGVIINAQQTYDEATGDIEQLMEELRNTWELPIDFISG